jgi:hypothetical protein
MFELCRGLNEREGALGIGKTVFYKADGTTGSDLSMEDLYLIPILGEDSPFCENLRTIQGRIKHLLRFGPESEVEFVSALNSDTVVDIAYVEGVWGESFVEELKKPNQAKWWQQCQDALDMMLYWRREGDALFLPPDSASPENVTWSDWQWRTTTEWDLHDAWNRRTALSTDTNDLWASAIGIHETSPERGVGYRVDLSIGGMSSLTAAWQHRSSEPGTLDLSQYSGELGEVYLDWRAHELVYVSPPVHRTVSVEINDELVTLSADPESGEWVGNGPNWIITHTMDLVNNSFRVVLPELGSSIPFPGDTAYPGSYPARGRFLAWAHQYKIYGDLSSALTDQQVGAEEE